MSKTANIEGEKNAPRHKHFKPYQRVLVMTHMTINGGPEHDVWMPVFYRFFYEKENMHILSNNVFITTENEDELIPYKGNEDLAGTEFGALKPIREE